MDKALRILAFLCNGLFVLWTIVLWLNERPHGAYQLLFGAMVLVPLINTVALQSGPDREERTLRRQVTKAELRARLKELGQSQS